MSNTLATVLITIAAVQTVNFILLVLGENFNFGWKYEDWTKRICCLVPWLIITLFLLPRLIYTAVKRLRHPASKYVLYRIRSNEAYLAQRVFIGKSKTYQDAVDMMNEDVESLNEQTGMNFKLGINNRDCSYIFKEDDGSVIMYEIVKQ